MIKASGNGFKDLSLKARLEALKNLPPEITQRRQFIGYNREKRPVDPRTGQIFVKDPEHPFASTPSKWSSWERALELVEHGQALGVGIVLTLLDALTIIDIDNVRDSRTGEIKPWALDLIGLFSPCLMEISSGGKGIHIIFFNDHAEPLEHNGHYLWRGHKIEIYETGRYFAMTGQLHDGPEAAERAEQLGELLAEAEPVNNKGELLRSSNVGVASTRRESHPVSTAAMMDLFASLGVPVDVDCTDDHDHRYECTFHDSNKHPGRGGDSLLINPQRGWKCWGGCGEGGLVALREKLLLQSDDELATIAHRTGVKLAKLIELRESLMPEPARKDVVVSIEPPEDLTKHYLEILRGYDGYVPLNKCGTYTISSNGLYETVRHNPCKKWACHYCGTRRRALDEIGLIPIAQGLKEFYYTVISDNEWKTNELSRRKRFSILKVKFRYFKTRQYPGQIVLLSTHPYNVDSELIPLEDRASLIRNLLEDLRKQAHSGERLTDGSRSWSTNPKKKTAQKTAEKPADDIIDVEEAEIVFRGFSACEPRRALEFAIAVGLADAGEELDMRLWPDGERRPAMVRFVRHDDSKYQEWMMKLQMREGLRGVG